MSTPVITQPNLKAGLCPHGLPPSACPICSGGGSGGGVKTSHKTSDAPNVKPMASNQWSWMKCYIAGINMRSDELRLANAKQGIERQMEALKNFQKEINQIVDKVINNLQNIQNSLPNALKIPVQVISALVIMPVLNLISQIPKLLEKLVNLESNIRNFIHQAGEKLSALIGDFKNFVKSKLEEVKKKFKKLFLFFNPDIEDENYKNDEALAVFKSQELKKHLLKILKVEKKQEENDNGSNKKQ